MNMNQTIRAYIEESGLKFSHVAEKSGIGIKKFSRQMNNKQGITTDEYEKICINGLSLQPTFFYDEKFLKSKNMSA